MAHTIPPGFISLADARDAADQSFKDIIGVVVDIMPPTVTRRGEHMLTFKLLDLRLADAIGGREGFTIRYFNRDESELPKVRSIGDVVHIRQIRIMSVYGQKLGLTHWRTKTIVIPSASIPAPAFSIGFQDKNRIEGLGTPLALQDFGLLEQHYIIALRHSAGMTSVIEERLARMSASQVQPASIPAAIPTGPAGMAAGSKPIPTGPASMTAGSRPIPTGPANMVAGQRPVPQGPASMTTTLKPIPTGPASMTARPLAQQQKQKFVEEPGAAVQPAAKRAKTMATFGYKFKLIQNLQPNMFADICGEVVKMFPAQWGCDLYITDYTPNEQMRYYPKPEEETDQERDGDTYGYTGPPKKAWPGPYEWLVLKVNLKYPHASYANEYVKEGDCVLLQNVKGNLSREGSSRLEADLWAEYDAPDKIKIKKLKDASIPEIQALKLRKEKYWASRGVKPGQSEEETTESKAKKKEAAKKLKKKERRAARLAQEVEEAAELAKKSLNRNMRCTHEDVPVTKVLDILDPQNTKHINSAPDGREYILPFINVKYRAKVRVVDYEPKDLEDFAVRPETEYSSDDDPDDMDWVNTSSPSYEWYFSLLLEDASMPPSANETERQRIWVHVHHENAQFLLGKLGDPEDLQHNSSLLSELREKLFLMWGNLEETGGGEEELSNLPFECVIMEYGIPLEEGNEASLGNWKRMYAMEGASIL